jgi:hypothetical protein
MYFQSKKWKNLSNIILISLGAQFILVSLPSIGAVGIYIGKIINFFENPVIIVHKKIINIILDYTELSPDFISWVTFFLLGSIYIMVWIILIYLIYSAIRRNLVK